MARHPLGDKMNKCSCGFRIGHPEFSKCICKITKPLSDDEIYDCVGKVALADDFYPEEIPSNRFLKCFARAIEERHGIK